MVMHCTEQYFSSNFHSFDPENTEPMLHQQPPEGQGKSYLLHNLNFGAKHIATPMRFIVSRYPPAYSRLEVQYFHYS